ncbi:hypothetical protein YC2023_064610 [Brassica napus]
MTLHAFPQRSHYSISLAVRGCGDTHTPLNMRYFQISACSCISSVQPVLSPRSSAKIFQLRMAICSVSEPEVTQIFASFGANLTIAWMEGIFFQH